MGLIMTLQTLILSSSIKGRMLYWFDNSGFVSCVICGFDRGV